jgi:hypothetical protein
MIIMGQKFSNPLATHIQYNQDLKIPITYDYTPRYDLTTIDMLLLPQCLSVKFRMIYMEGGMRFKPISTGLSGLLNGYKPIHPHQFIVPLMKFMNYDYEHTMVILHIGNVEWERSVSTMRNETWLLGHRHLFLDSMHCPFDGFSIALKQCDFIDYINIGFPF